MIGAHFISELVNGLNVIKNDGCRLLFCLIYIFVIVGYCLTVLKDALFTESI